MLNPHAADSRRIALQWLFPALGSAWFYLRKVWLKMKWKVNFTVSLSLSDITQQWLEPHLVPSQELEAHYISDCGSNCVGIIPD